MTIVTLEQVERLAAKLPPQEQLKLVSRISDRLSLHMPSAEQQQREYHARMAAFLKLADEMAAETIGEIDSAEEIRQMREARHTEL